MNNLLNNLDQLQNYLDLWDSSNNIWTNNWLTKAQKLTDQLFSNQREKSESVTEIIVQLREIFEQMNYDVNVENRRSYCRVIFDYCELTQDWRDWGNWTQQEIELGVGTDAPWLYYGLGRYLEEIGQLQKSIDYHQAGIAASQEAEDQMFLACNHLGAGIALQRYNQPDDAESHLFQALKLFKQQKHLYLQAHTLVNLGSLYDRFEQSKRAIIPYQESASILRTVGNYFDLGRILYSLAIAHLNLNQLTEAETVFSEAKQLCKDTENWYFLALNYYGIGWLEYKCNNFKKSQHYLEKSLRQIKKAKELGIGASQLSFPEIEGNIYVLAAAAYSKGSEPNFEAAQRYLEQAELAYNQLDYAEEKLLNVLANRARISEYSENWTKAIATFSELLKEGKRLNSQKKMGDAATHLVRIYRKKSASFWEWVKLLNQLEFFGIISLLSATLDRLNKYISVKLKGS
jgi:tetratricopeptide (TPR) repeat protein